LTRITTLTPEFIELAPPELQVGVLYVSMRYSTAIHRCCCGCGRKVVTPLSPTDWQLFFDGDSVSLTPSIGNWSFKCQSHYWIRKNRVEWAPRWTRKKIEAGRALARLRRVDEYATTGIEAGEEVSAGHVEALDFAGLI
jgi:Family of unknown function (DUF6527)